MIFQSLWNSLGIAKELKRTQKELPMTDYCVFSKDYKCIKRISYELFRHELEEADGLRHNN